ncbi:MAG: GTP-binding protein, partial [Prevotellaceae bacterium]|nr:GTP-binding protein [Prevotellaceae bacterium]
MRVYQTEEIRNIVLLGNAGAGKTTLAEAMMFDGKVIDRRGTVEAKNTVSDSAEIEQIYQRSIYSSVLFTEYNDKKINLIDSPGSDDFSGGTFAAFKVADTGVMVINAQNGVEVGTEIFARYAERHEKPMIIAVNYLDHDKANWDNTLDSLRQTFGNKLTLVQYPVNPGNGFNEIVDVLLMKLFRFKDDNGTFEAVDIPASELERAQELNAALIESAAENDESLMELFFEKGVLTEDEIRKGLRAGLKSRGVIPIFCMSAKKDIGTKRLLEFIINVAPKPNESREYKIKEGEVIPCNSNGSPSLFIFKTAVEQHLGEVSYFRVMSGKITEGMDLINANNGTKERISALYAVAGKKREKVTEMIAGDIGCTVKLKSSRRDQTLNGDGKRWQFLPVKYPDPKFRTAIKAK